METTLPIGISSGNIITGPKVMAQKMMFLIFDYFDLDLDISRSFDFCEFTMFPCMIGVNFEEICSLLAEI